MTEDTSLREKALRDEWLVTVAPHIDRFEFSALHDTVVTYDPHGSAAMAKLIRKMATLLDKQAGLSEAKDRRIEALKAVLHGYEDWEADLIVNGDWSGDTVRMTQEQHERMLELQAIRNAALSGKEGQS